MEKSMLNMKPQNVNKDSCVVDVTNGQHLAVSMEKEVSESVEVVQLTELSSDEIADGDLLKIEGDDPSDRSAVSRDEVAGIITPCQGDMTKDVERAEKQYSVSEESEFLVASPCQGDMTKDVERAEKQYSVSEESDSQTNSRLTVSLQSFASESQLKEEDVDDSLSCEGEEHTLKKIRKSARQSKPTEFYKAIGLKSPTAAVSSSDGELQPSDQGRPFSTQKCKAKVSRCRRWRDVNHRSLGINQGAGKTVLVTLRASQDTEEDDVESDVDYDDDETYLLSPEEVNKAPAFVPVSLRSPEPVPLQLEETVEELEILVNAPDAHCASEMEHLPHNLRGFGEPVVQGGDILPSENHMGLQAEIDYTDTREEKGKVDYLNLNVLLKISLGIFIFCRLPYKTCL
ncbi:transcription factor TFIIIB component B'' homolog [Protopterus annectens]|uniref:transcription factor TFIIIB component B'' homolog n=1 Tax=Protopterus annectens TaxID=7888 RepID=UPI001CFB59AA|nr:transcription factor TFIIIB component B'' homolog [Protopterus annectens]